MSAASVMAAGSVMRDPMSGTNAKQSHTCATAVRMGASRATKATRAWMISTTGREAATTMMTKTNKGSVY